VSQISTPNRRLRHAQTSYRMVIRTLLNTSGEQPRLVYRISETARLLGISRTTVYELIRAGKISPIRLGPKTVRIAHKEVERLISDLQQETK